jgi:hypothetical protein
MSNSRWQHVRVEAHELHIALGKWESEYFGTVLPTVGAAHEQQVFLFLSYFGALCFWAF